MKNLIQGAKPRISAAQSDKKFMKQTQRTVRVGDVFKTNRHGYCSVVKYEGCFSVTVKFIDSGHECVTSSDQLRKGTVKDRFAITTCGVGYLGEKVPYVESIYTCWVNMLKRCYDPKVQAKHPTYIGCSVCDEWLCYSNFFQWMSSRDHLGMELDKDKKIKGNKVYSPDTCELITLAENIRVTFSKTFQLRHKNGTCLTVTNLLRFCRENKLNHTGMHRVKSGDRKTHKGWVSVQLIN